MTEETMKPSRRAALGAIVSVPALAILPATAHVSAPALRGAENVAKAASGPTLDAILFALIDAARDLDGQGKEAFAAATEATRRTEKVPAPEAVIVTEDDTRLWKLNAGDPFDESHLDLLRKRQTHRQNAKSLRLFSDILADAPISQP